MAIITALPATTSGLTVSSTPFTMPNLAANVANPATEYRRTIQSIVVLSLEALETEYRILYGTRAIFQFKLKQNETFTVEGLKMTQLSDITGSTNNDATKISCQTVTAGKTVGANVVVSYATITIVG